MNLSRRSFLAQAAGAGLVACAPGVFARTGSDGILLSRHHTPRAKRIIWLYMAGGPSQLELFDHKPTLEKYDGEAMPESLTEGQQIAQLQNQELKVKAPVFRFRNYGESGIGLADLLPYIGANVADRMTLIRTLRTEQINHDPAHAFMNTGARVAGRPSLGSWLHYGLGAQTEELPPYVVMVSGSTEAQPISAGQWHSGFLPSRYQGVEFQSGPQPVYYLDSPGVSATHQRMVVDKIRALNTAAEERLADPEIATRNTSYELARKMQMTLPGLADIDSEPDSIKKLYGIGHDADEFARNCLLARKLVEQGVSMVQLYHRGWDLHDGIKQYLPRLCYEVDRATAALVLDLEQHGLLDDTLVVWGGEFGRTPMSQGRDGRDHHINNFSMFLVGGGVRGGHVHGVSDDFGYNAAEDPVHVHDLHATILHLLGIDHERLTYRFQGRDFRLTDVHGRVINDVVA